MKCESCSSEINPQWAHAIDKNMCPFCGSAIMNENLKNLFSNLRNTMKSLEAYPEQLNDWMFSNYKYIKTDSPNLINFVPQELLVNARKNAVGEPKIIKVKNPDGTEDEVIAQKLQSEEQTEGYFKRAGVLKQGSRKFNSVEEKTAHLKAMADQIRREGIADGKAFLAGNMEDVDPEDLALMAAELEGADGVEEISELDRDIPPALLAMSKKSSGGSLTAIKMQEAEEKARLARQRFESGDSRVGKNGFSRSS